MTASAITMRRASAADAGAIARVYVQTWRATYRGQLPGRVLRNLSEIRETLQWWTSLCTAGADSAIYVAVDGARGVVGFAAAGRERKGRRRRRAEVYTLYVLPSHQRRGLGRRLVASATRRLGERGFESLIIWVLASNPARAFYETLGGRPAGARTIRVGGRHVQEIAYAWPRLDGIAAAAGSASRP